MVVTTTPLLAETPLVARASGWADYGLVDSGDGRKLERCGPHTLVRPEPQCLWRPRLDKAIWAAADAVFDPSDEDESGR
jgi:23S rRNA (cytosine1962-C5)-methyltransferase